MARVVGARFSNIAKATASGLWAECGNHHTWGQIGEAETAVPRLGETHDVVRVLLMGKARQVMGALVARRDLREPTAEASNTASRASKIR